MWKRLVTEGMLLWRSAVRRGCKASPALAAGKSPMPGSPRSHRPTPLPRPASPARGIRAFLACFVQEKDLFVPHHKTNRGNSLKAAFLAKRHSLSTAVQKLEPEKLHLKTESLLREPTCRTCLPATLTALTSPSLQLHPAGCSHATHGAEEVVAGGQSPVGSMVPRARLSRGASRSAWARGSPGSTQQVPGCEGEFELCQRTTAGAEGLAGRREAQPGPSSPPQPTRGWAGTTGDGPPHPGGVNLTSAGPLYSQHRDPLPVHSRGPRRTRSSLLDASRGDLFLKA